VVNFFGTWCPPCLQEMPSLLLLAEALKDQPFVVLAVDVGDSPARVRQVFGEQKPAFTILLDHGAAAARSWGALGFPASYVLDAESRIRYSAHGPLAWDDLGVAKQIVALLPKTTLPLTGSSAGSREDAQAGVPGAD
jgi:thiol-disulfide isomerase/thioredoxin